MEFNPRVLIVDDEPFNLDYLEQELEDQGYQTISATNGLDAIQIVENEPIDLILLDIMMPGMDGFEVLTRLKGNKHFQHIPIIVISAMSDMGSTIRGIELGAEDFLSKPFDDVLLNARINSALEKKHLRDLEKIYLRSLEKELEIGHQIQSGFLPSTMPKLTGWCLEAFFRPAREVAGDFYDVFDLPDGKLVILLGDVADKGVGSALFMALYRSLLRSALHNVMLLDDPGNKLVRAVNHTNNYVCSTHEDALFATLFVGILEPETASLTYVNAGHNPPILLQGQKQTAIRPTGPALGFFENQDFQAEQITLNVDDTLFIYSDGLEDVKNISGEFYGTKRLFDSFSAEGASVNSIIGKIEAFMEDDLQFDDLTLLVIKRE